MAKRYFLDTAGARTTRMRGRPGEGHIDIAKEVLPQQGITPVNDRDCYDQMFRLRFVRVVEFANGNVEVEHGPPLTAAQKRFFEELRREGRKVIFKKTSV